jgi:hypothetical protein
VVGTIAVIAGEVNRAGTPRGLFGGIGSVPLSALNRHEARLSLCELSGVELARYLAHPSSMDQLAAHKYLRSRILVVSGRIFLEACVSSNVYGPQEGLATAPNFRESD